MFERHQEAIMKTRCTQCQTVFRVTPEQLKARAGKVRCGRCQTVFNALDSLLEEAPSLPLAPVSPPEPEPAATLARVEAPEVMAEAVTEKDIAEKIALDDEPFIAPMSETEAQEFGRAAGMILPREMTEVPGYSKWSAGVIAEPFAIPQEKPIRWPFMLTAFVLLLVLAAQLAFHFRSKLVIAFPPARPVLEAFCQLLDADIPLPRQVELVSIEASDLHNDPARKNLLILNATVRNRVAYGQAYPALELSLTDTQDKAIARRVFTPEEYLPARLASSRQFAASSDIAVRLWIEAQEITAAGYRLYVFYP